MGKIRSTLDIVLERTKDLTITDEQKAGLRSQEWTQKARGLFQRFRSGAMGADDLRAELARGKAEYPELEGILKQEFVQALDPAEDYRVIVGGLKDVLGLDPTPYIERLEGFAEVLAGHERAACERLLSDLRKRGISGSGVLPNLEADQTWQDFKAGLRVDLTRELLAL